MSKIGINIGTGSLQQTDMIVCVDIGNTHNVTAAIHPDTRKPFVLNDHNGERIIRSTIAYDEADNLIFISNEAGSLASKGQITSVLRLVGKTFEEIRGYVSSLPFRIVDDGANNLKIEVGSRLYSPEQLLGFILKAITERAAHILKTPVLKVVMPVPVYFRERQKEAVREACVLANLELVATPNKAEAAIWNYLAIDNHLAGKTIAVFDMGGASYEITLAKVSADSITVLSSQGDSFLGGNDLDNTIVTHWLNDPVIFENQLLHPNLVDQLRIAAEAAKIKLDVADLYTGAAAGFNLSLSRSEFVELIKPLVEKSIISCINGLRDAKLEPNDIAELILIGAGSRTPMIRNALSALFEKEGRFVEDPAETVVLGAALHSIGNVK